MSSPSFSDVYEEYFDFVWRCLALLGVQSDHLEDAAQDVMLVVLRRLDGFEGRSTLRTWVFGIAHNVAANHRRRFSRKGQWEALPAMLEAPDPDPRQSAMEREDLDFVQRYVNNLDETDRSLFFAYYIEGMSAKEVAEALQLEVNAVYTRSRSLRRGFQQALRERASQSFTPRKVLP